MKKFFTLFLMAMAINSLIAQAPEAFKFQTVIRNADGEVMPNQDVTLKFLLHQDEPEGDVVYEEQHITTTNPMGLVSLNIGAGEVISGDFSQIMWGEHPYFLEEQIDIGNTGDFQTFGTVQLLSVPYALHANTAGNGILSMTTVQRDSLENPAVGMQIYNTTTNCLNYWNGSNWFETCGECTPQPDDANAGPNQEYTDSTTVAQMQANTPDPGEGTWEKISFYPGYFEDMNDPNTKFHGEPCKEYYLKWIISTSCGSDSDYVKVTFNNTPSDAIAGNDTTINTETTTIGLNATQPENGEGLWNIVSGEGGSFADDTNPATTFTGLDCTAYELAWTVATECSENTDTVNIEFYAIPTAANAGQDTTINDDNLTINLGANTAEVGIGTWSIFSGDGGSFENENDPNTTFTAEPCQTYELVWTIATACESSSDTVVVDFFTIPTQADAGEDQLGLEGTWTNLEANTPELGTGHWTILSGEGGQITSPDSPTSIFLGQSMEHYILEWEISTACDTTNDEVNIAFGFTPFLNCGDTLIDERDGQKYATVQIGEQCWMAENLAYLPSVSPSDETSLEPIYYVYNYQGTNVQEAKSTENFQTYGALYNWVAAILSCPEGWYLPNDDEWKIMEGTVDSQFPVGDPEWDSFNYRGFDVGLNLKSTTGWESNGNGNNTFNFSAIPAGACYSPNDFGNVNESNYFWTRTEDISPMAYMRLLSFDHDNSFRGNLYVKSWGFSVRCIKNNGNVNLKPIKPYNPKPANTSTSIDNDTIISWSCKDIENNPLTYDVYFGTPETPPQVATAITDTFYNPGTLDYATTYFWKIVAHDDQGNATESEVWNFNTMDESWQCGDAFVDDRDGKSYSSVQIGEQCWMAENLNIGDRIDGSEDMTDNGTFEKYCFDDDPTNCETYGGLYQWYEMMQYTTTAGVQGICPDGWHVPTDDEWKILEGTVDSQYPVGDPEWDNTGLRGFDAGLNLKSTSGWNSNGNGTDLYGFSALPGGHLNINHDFMGHDYGYWWTSDEYLSYSAWYRRLDFNDKSNRVTDNKYYGFSVRCLRDESIPPTTYNLLLETEPTEAGAVSGAGEYAAGAQVSISADANQGWEFVNWTDEDDILISTEPSFEYIMPNEDATLTANFEEEQTGFTCGDPLIDSRDGQSYETVQIGEQCWMAENLNVGSKISMNTVASDNGMIEKYCYEDMDVNCDNYGGLYDWNELMAYSVEPGSQGICPEGWYVPTEDDLDNLIFSFGGYDISGGKLKETGYTHWSSPNAGATNESGFTGLPGGYRYHDPYSGFGYDQLSFRGYFWSSTRLEATGKNYEMRAMGLRHHDDNASFGTYNAEGFFVSLRCLKFED